MIESYDQASSQRDQKQKVLLERILRDGKQGKNQLADDQVEVLLLRFLQLNLSSLHGQVDLNFSVEFPQKNKFNQNLGEVQEL